MKLLTLIWALISIAISGFMMAAGNEEPSLLVIRDEPMTNSQVAPRWNNQQLKRRQNQHNSYHQIESHHHSYKYMGLIASEQPIYPAPAERTTTKSRSKTSSRGSTKALDNRGKRPQVDTRQHLQPGDWLADDNQPKRSNETRSLARKTTNKKHLVCYYGSWAVYRPDAGKYPVENIDPFLCTHIIYGFTGLSHDNLIKVLDPWNDLEDNYGKGAMKRFTRLKRLNPELKTLVAIGGRSNETRSLARKTTNKKHLVCYYGSWAVYRPDAGKYPVENIDPFLCTHIIYGFTGLSHDNLIKVLDPWNDLEDNYGKGAMKRFTRLKRLNPELKTLVAIGGWNEGSIKYSRMASEPEARARFIKSVVEFLARYDFDGLDLDWEYPGSRGGHSYDKQNFVRLIRELKEAFAPKGYLLTAAVSAGKWFIDPAYDIAEVGRHLDLINLMAYDYHGGWEPKTGMNAPLFPSKRHDRTAQDQLLNVNWSVNYWLQNGAPREKLMLGVGSYGRSFTLDKPQQDSGINAPASQKGRAGPYTREPGSLGYNEICEQFQRQPRDWTIVRDPDYLAPYAYNNNERQWVGYDDMESLQLKAQFANSIGLGGMMVWSLETDDFQGRCHGQKYPLLNTLRRTLDGAGKPVPGPAPTTARPAASSTPGHEVEEEAASGSTSTTSTSTRRPARPTSTPTSSTSGRPSRRPTSTTSTTSTTTTARPRPQQTGEFSCTGDGMFADPANCRRFVRCVSGYGPNGYTIYRFDCGPGTAFSEELQSCDHIYNVARCHQSSNQLARAAAKGARSSSFVLASSLPRRNWY